MTLKSMTGFGRVEGSFEDWSWVWEVRALNGKSLDIRLKLPDGFENLEPHIRKQISSQVQRGSLQINLKIHTTGQDLPYRLNSEWLRTLVNLTFELNKENGIKAAQLDGLYAVKGVVEEVVPSAADPKYKRRNQRLLTSLEAMLHALNEARLSEGMALTKILTGNVKAMAEETAKARECSASTSKAIKQKFNQRFEELLGDKLPKERLIQEAAILAVKADVREELDRLGAHLKQALMLIKQGSPIGRKLDFLSQEILREINTLCSKSTDIALTKIGLELKSLVEQFREQAANVE